MTIELAPKVSSASAGNSTSTDDSSKATSSARHDPKDGTGFLSILGLLGDPDQGTLTIGNSDEQEDPNSTLLLGALVDGQGNVKNTLNEAPADASFDPAALLAQLQLVPVAPDPSQSVPEGVGSVVVGVKFPPFHKGAVNGEVVSNLDAASPKANKVAIKSGKAALDAVANAVNLDTTKGEDSRQVLGAHDQEGKFTLPESVVKAVREVAITLAKSPEVSTFTFAGNREKSQEAHQSIKGAINDPVVTVAPGTGGAMGVDGVAANSNTSAANGQFAEEVKYWMSGDVQKAELTLDDIGAAPVEISISMQGNEASVIFRTDEAQTRDALVSASADLKSSLDRQGVLLSGVSVGTSNTGGQPQQQSGRQQAGWGAARVEAASSSPPPIEARTGVVASNRSIDLFV